MIYESRSLTARHLWPRSPRSLHCVVTTPRGGYFVGFRRPVVAHGKVSILLVSRSCKLSNSPVFSSYVSRASRSSRLRTFSALTRLHARHVLLYISNGVNGASNLFRNIFARVMNRSCDASYFYSAIPIAAAYRARSLFFPETIELDLYI